jgi:hypothetical protein
MSPDRVDLCRRGVWVRRPLRRSNSRPAGAKVYRLGVLSIYDLSGRLLSDSAIAQQKSTGRNKGCQSESGRAAAALRYNAWR